MVAAFSVKAQIVATVNGEEQPPMFADWEAKPHMHPIPVGYFKEHSVIVLQSEKRNYIYEGSDITMYSTIHRIVKVLDRRGIEDFNTITIPFRTNQSRIDSVKARVILPDGTTHDLKYEMMYIGEGGLLFALDGIEKNSEIEIMVKYKALSSYFGSINFQYSSPVLNTFFELTYPKEMTFNTKGYHGFPSGTEEMVGNHKRIKIYQPEIPALENQDNSFYDLYRMRLEYGIDHFVNRGGYQRGEDFTYDKLAQNMYTRFYDKNIFDKRLPNSRNVRMDQIGLKESERLAVNKFLTSIGLKGTESDKEKIKMIEDGIKSNIMQYWELSSREGENLDTVLAKKSATAAGLVRLFAVCFRVTGIEHELGVVSDRREHVMDAKFINWAPLENYVFYFPAFDAYLAPAEQYYRYPEIPYTMIGNKGVFTRTNPDLGYVIGRDVAAADAILRTILPNEAHTAAFKMNTEISINKDMDANADITCTYTGYSAADLRLKLAAAPKDKIKEIIKDEVRLADKQEDLIRYSTSNESFTAIYGNKPLIINGIVRLPDLVEKAGNRYILNIGDAIGTQEPMYDKKDRVLPVDLDYPYTNTYTITVNIPKEYKVVDAESMTIDVEQTDKDNGNTVAYFKSNWRMQNNKMVITVNESYPKIHYAVRDYEDYRKVMNAAADFNKGVVVLEKIPVIIKRHKKPVEKSVLIANSSTAATTTKVVPAAKTTSIKNTPAQASAAKPAPAKAATPQHGQILPKDGDAPSRPLSLPAQQTKPIKPAAKRTNKA